MGTTVGKYFTAILVLIIGAGATVAAAAALYVLQVKQYPIHAQAASASQHVNLTLQTFPQSPDSLPQWEQEHHYKILENHAIPVENPHLDWVMYGPSTNLVVPANSTVTMTIYQYDSGGSLLNNFYTNVRGTVGNTMTVDGKTLSSIPADQVGHTFTIHGIPSDKQPWLFVNVPLEKMSDDAVNAGTDNGLVPNPHKIVFTFKVGGPGHYVWNCEYPCGSYFNGFGGAMSTNGFMNGTFTVQ